jgi:hypothetical protein
VSWSIDHNQCLVRALFADGVTKLSSVGELLISGYPVVGQGPYMYESGIDWAPRSPATVAAMVHDPRVIQRQALVGICRESLHVREDRVEDVPDDRLATRYAPP